MSTEAPAATPIIHPSVRTPSASSTFLTPIDSPIDAGLGGSDYFMAEDTRGGDPSASTTESRSAEHETTITTAVRDPEESSLLPPLTDRDDSSLFPLSSENGDHDRGNNQTLIEEHEMRQKLMDMESSFLPEPSTIEVAATGPRAGADDTYLVGVDGGHDMDMTQQTDSSQFSFIPPSETTTGPEYTRSINFDQDGIQIDEPEPEPESTNHEERPGNETLLDSLASSPSAAAMFRSVQRNQSRTAEDVGDNSQFSQEERPFRSQLSSEESQLTPSKLRRSSRSVSPGPARLFSDQSFGTIGSRRSGSRPKYLTSRQSANRLSHSSINSTNTDTTNSDATLGADYAYSQVVQHLTSGSWKHGIWCLRIQRREFLGQAKPTRAHRWRSPNLGREESSPRSTRQQATFDEAAPETPKAKPADKAFPSDTAIAERVKGVHVPSVFAQRYREEHGPSPDKRAGTTPAFGRSGRNLTLKEQSSTIDRLSKENFDLKMRIHFLNEALNKRSEEGIKEMISENVELKSDKLKLQKDNSGLKRRIRELEKQLKDRESDKESMLNHDPEGSEDGDRNSAHETEVIYLRERVETYELEVERLRSESIARESEKRRLAEMVKNLSENRQEGSESGAREERGLWKDMLDAETAARELAEEENRKLRDETIRLRSELYSSNVGSHPGVRPGTRDHGSTVSYTSVSESHGNRGAAISTSNSTLLVEHELLKQENAELRKEVSAQTSMLTSRNREKERLYQEIEELKLGQGRHGGRSIAGDSIFDRSASRAQGRSGSEPSDGGVSRSDMDRDELEARNGQLRDQVSTLKLENQAVRSQLDDCIRDYEELDAAYQADVDQAEAEIQSLQQERDQALQMADERDSAFQDLRAEAQEELDVLGDELDQKIVECQRLNEELRNQDESLRVLQAEMRSASEGIIRLEEDAQNNLERYKAVQQELEQTNGEMESLEKSLFEANTKVQRLTVQIESSQNEIAFLREEQDGDKIRIGDLESELKTYQMSLHSEKDKTRELEHRLADERHQREMVGSKEKQEVQRIMNELNREASAAKEEARRLKKSLSTQEIETSTWRERLMDLENNLRETLGDLSGSRSSLITNIMKLQKELESTALELESIRSQLDEKETLLKNRDALLESHGLESRKLSELLEKERQARRADKQSFDSSLKSHQQASRSITQSNSRITELEHARNQDRKRFTALESQYREQLNERNAMLLTVWKKVSNICGADWAHSNSLINGNLPSQEVISNILFWPGFSRNLLLAIKTVEGVISQFKGRIKSVEVDLNKQYQNLEHSFHQRVRRLERVEETVKNLRAGRSHSSSSSEVSKLRGENRLLKAELNLLQSNTRGHSSASSAAAAVMASTGSPRSSSFGSAVENQQQLTRHHSTSGASEKSRPERGLTRSSTGLSQPTYASSGSTLAANSSSGAMVHRTRSNQTGPWENMDEKWIHRLRELEKRLKSEREGRLLDRDGARKRIEERDAEVRKLNELIQRERLRRGVPPSGAIEDGRHRGPVSDGAVSSSEGEGFVVDIEV
ncbi:hypothetical protein N7468_009022 [Penicillium chermesinum]|uniref:Anucleate primary sterigmata protein B n=1 Tax=Penicillium chermesinum TaxID=63820 RepID=A0A9W9NJM4_9EURO|nr:uncharacterized protein N7468_009022 [Penicillium chermesinum]KAJ5219818.1 hypothetical protein N7468_009022 [Penicillium chermesinum]